jgi:MoxR-like ATPase
VGGANGAARARDTRERIQQEIIGRESELELLLAAVAAGRDIVLEGPPGTSKTTMLRAITAHWGIPLLLVEGNAELTPGKLIGHHHPARVLREGYTEDNFVPGPLITAMRDGGFLYLEEFNRAPEDTLNTLLSAIADRRLVVPRFGEVVAEPTFRLVASMNPFDNVGTVRLSRSLLDRLCRLTVDYQDEDAEQRIVALRGGVDGGGLEARLVADAVAVTRATREHRDVRQGSSVRGAIDAVLVAMQLLPIRGVERADDLAYGTVMLDAILVALSGRIYLDEASETTPERVLREIWSDVLAARGAAAAPG